MATLALVEEALVELALEAELGQPDVEVADPTADRADLDRARPDPESTTALPLVLQGAVPPRSN